MICFVLLCFFSFNSNTIALVMISHVHGVMIVEAIILHFHWIKDVFVDNKELH